MPEEFFNGLLGLPLHGALARLRRFLSIIGDPDDNVAVHAVVAASGIVRDTATTRAVCGCFTCGDRIAASASEILARAESADLRVLLKQASVGESESAREWAIASLARRKAAEVRGHPHWAELGDEFRSALEHAWFGPENS